MRSRTDLPTASNHLCVLCERQNNQITSLWLVGEITPVAVISADCYAGQYGGGDHYVFKFFRQFYRTTLLAKYCDRDCGKGVGKQSRQGLRGRVILIAS